MILDGTDEAVLEVTHDCDWAVEEARPVLPGDLFNEPEDCRVSLLLLPLHQAEKRRDGDVVGNHNVKNVQLRIAWKDATEGPIGKDQRRGCHVGICGLVAKDEDVLAFVCQQVVPPHLDELCDVCDLMSLLERSMSCHGSGSRVHLVPGIFPNLTPSLLRMLADVFIQARPEVEVVDFFLAFFPCIILPLLMFSLEGLTFGASQFDDGKLVLDELFHGSSLESRKCVAMKRKNDLVNVRNNFGSLGNKRNNNGKGTKAMDALEVAAVVVVKTKTIKNNRPRLLKADVMKK